MTLLSGPTFAPSTLQRGVDEWIASLPASPARISRSLAGALGSTASAADCSSRSFASQPIAVRGSCFWRTSQASLLPPPPLWTRKKASSTSAPPPESWENWPTSGGMRSGSLFQRPTWAPATGGQGGSASRGAWLTPAGMAGMDATGKAGAGREFAQQAQQWMTPNVPNGGRVISASLVESKGTTPEGTKRTVPLESQVRHWPSPTAQADQGPDSSNRQGGPRWCRRRAHGRRHRRATTRARRGGGKDDGALQSAERPDPAGVHRALGIFAPGPADPRWAGILAEHPELAPALEPAFRCVVDGLAFDMGDSRAPRLKCIGNGVVALCAATAFVVLARRGGLLNAIESTA